jgi:7-cyano-7-deazaguanine synthase
MMQRKQFVLFSGGLDSATVLYHALLNFPEGSAHGDERFGVEAVSIDYGQRHAKEMKFAEALANLNGIHHTVLKMPDLLSGSMLTSFAPIPEVSYADLPHGISPTYVPFRNGLMLSMLAAYAQKWVGEQIDSRRATIYIGAHSEDAANDAYPDCSPMFLASMMSAIDIGTYHTVNLEAPLAGLQKADVVKKGSILGVPFASTWSCYKGGSKHCGKCPTCRARREAFTKAGISDPTQYDAAVE